MHPDPIIRVATFAIFLDRGVTLVCACKMTRGSRNLRTVVMVLRHCRLGRTQKGFQRKKEETRGEKDTKGGREAVQ
jgi:hypothetical protein